MSPKLKPLLLPQIVEQRKREEQELQEQQKQQQQLLLQQQLPAQQTVADGDLSYVFYTNNSSSSDVASPSPVTPTFSRGSHSRYSGSTSSLELMPSSCSDSPASPSQLAHSTKSGKRQLPDVQEDPSEREEEESTLVPDSSGLYNCLCDVPCSHRDVDLAQSAINSYDAFDLDYDLGFLSDSDYNGSLRSPKKRRSGSVSPLSGFSTRFGTRFNTLARWRSSKRVNPTFSPASETSLDYRPSLTMSRAASSRSSSVSAPTKLPADRSNEPPLPTSPAPSFYGSTESFELPAALDIEKANVRLGIERDRAMATTPLLPPLLTEHISSQTASLQPSPLQSPAVVPSPNPDAPNAQLYSCPPLSTRPSIASFRRMTGTSISSPPSYTPSEIPSPAPMPNLLDQYDEWSDRLGHANFTITPKPYQPEEASVEILRSFRSDWDQAKINYTKHLVRTGEHYGTTSNTYALTEAKWAEIERQWQLAQTDLIDRVAKLGSEAAFASLQWHRLQEDVSPAAVPMMLDAEKFPERGDEDIVGPMVRDAVMLRDISGDEKKNGGGAFWKNLREKVGLRR